MTGDDISICIFFVAFMFWVIKKIASTGRIQNDPLPKPPAESQWDDNPSLDDRRNDLMDLTSATTTNPASLSYVFLHRRD